MAAVVSSPPQSSGSRSVVKMLSTTSVDSASGASRSTTRS
jgi:hypothetical protein